MAMAARALLLATGLAALLESAPSGAHHSRANFDLDRTIVLEGTVTKFRYRNPHGFLWLDVSDARGGTEEWAVELGSIPNLKQMGMDRDSLRPGDEVTVVVNPDRKAGSRYAFFVSLTTADGDRFAFDDVFAYSGAAKEAGKSQPGSTDFTGKWDEERSRRDTLLTAGLGDYPVTAKGRELVDRYDPADRPSFRCESAGLPFHIGTPYAIEITKTDDAYEIYFENPGITRVIHLTDEHPEKITPSVLGHSIGRLDGDVLIIDTIGFEPTPWGIAPGLDSSAEKHLVERYWMSDDGHLLHIEYTVTDPVYLAEPISRTHVKRLVPDYELTPWEECDPEAARQHLELESQ